MRKPIFALLIAAGPSACMPQYEIQADTLCSMTRPFEWSISDTKKSIRAMRVFNARRAAACRNDKQGV